MATLKSGVVSLVNKLALRACRYSWRVYQSVSVVVDDAGVKLPVGGGIGLDMLGEKTDLERIISWVYHHRSGAFIDVGANVGRALVALLRHDRTIPYIGFEPALRAAVNVSAIIRENAVSDTHSILPIGLSDTNGYAVLYSNGAADVSATMNCATRPAEVFKERSAVAIGRGDDYVPQHTSVALLKIDAEGAEVPVLKGFYRTLREQQPVVFIEILPIQELELGTYSREAFGELSDEARLSIVAERRKHAAAIRNVLHDHGYTLCKLCGSELLPNADVMQSNRGDYDYVAVTSNLLARAVRA